MKNMKLWLLVGVLILVGCFHYFELGQYASLEYIQMKRELLVMQHKANPLYVGGLFFLVYVLVTALSLPGAAIMTLLAGAIFGLFWGTLLVSFASSIGATLAFLIAKFIFHDWVQEKFGHQLEKINRGVQKEGAFYLFGLRLVPIFPFFMVNLVMALTPIKAVTFYWVSQLGMLLGTIVYVNAGTELAKLQSLSGIVSLPLLLSFAVLGIFPIIAKRILAALQARRVYQGFEKPNSFDNNIVVIGAGAAGLVTSYIAAAVKAKVTLIEEHKMGGDCLNTGCVPSKALIKSAKIMQQCREAEKYGLHVRADVDFKAVMSRVHNVIKEIEPHDSIERYTKLGVNCIKGRATITSPWSVKVNDKTITAKNIVIASGAEPLVPPIPGLDQVEYYTSDTIWNIEKLPQRLLVLGGGPIGCELAQAFARLGSEVVQLEMAERILIREDEEVSELVTTAMKQDGVDIKVNHRALKFVRDGHRQYVQCGHEGQEVNVTFDAALLALGRKPRVKGFGLENLGIDTTKMQTVAVNEYLQSKFPNIFACGDVAGPYQFTHTAAHQAWFATVNALFGAFKKFKVDYSTIPWVTFTAPEVARVGLSEAEAKAKNLDYEVTRYDLSDLDRAIAESENTGFVKVITRKGKDKVLGATIVGERAGDMLAEFVLMMRHGLGLNKLLSTIHPYPTWMEGNKFAAGEFKKKNAPEKVLEFLAKFHRMMRHEKD